MEEKSIFEMILDKELESEIIYEDEDIFSIKDINPIAPVHLLIIPKKRINTINDVSEEDTLLIGKMVQVAKKLAKEYEVDLDRFAISISFVLTIILSKHFDSLAILITQFIKGFPLNNLIFFFGILLLPPLAGIMQTDFIYY